MTLPGDSALGIETERLRLVPATADLIRAAIAGRAALAEALGAVVADGWPPEYLDEPALRWVLDRLAGDPRPDWYFYLVLLRDGGPLMGSAGYKGPPLADGTVEVGYGMVVEYQRKGYGPEATRALIERAFAHSAVTRVIAETLPDLVASIRVMERCGMTPAPDPGSEPGVLRYQLTRDDFALAGETQ
jgi:RimJ/RimL family protein N-acetyltransferase